MNAIPQKILETKVVDAVLEFYKPYFDKGGHKKLAEAVKRQVNFEGKELAAARQRAMAEHEKMGRIISNLLDNITPTNRDFVDQRLSELKQQKQQSEIRLEELDRLFTSQVEINSIVTDSMQFLSDLGFTFRQGLPQEKLSASFMVTRSPLGMETSLVSNHSCGHESPGNL